MRKGHEDPEEVGVREPSVIYSESGEYYFFVTGISDS